MKMYINGRWTDAPHMTPIIQSYTGETVDTVPAATPEQVEQALAAASKAAKVMGNMPAHERAGILNRAADLIDGHVEELARLVSLEAGKPISEARGEAGRIREMLRLSVFEGTQLRGETLPIDANAGTGKDKLGLTMRVPCEVVVAISPFNYPLLLVMHKIGPALSAGNVVILKPANQTPLSALKLTELLYEAGLPETGKWQIPLVVVSVLEKERVTPKMLANAQSYLESRGVTADFVTERGAVTKAIIRSAQLYKSDFIIMGGYGFNPVLEVMLGSEVDQILRARRWPVLICR